MPKLCEYQGITVLFYSNEQAPVNAPANGQERQTPGKWIKGRDIEVHVQGKCQGRESRAALVVHDGRIVDRACSPVCGRRPLEGPLLQHFQALVGGHADDIVRKWVYCFALHRRRTHGRPGPSRWRGDPPFRVAPPPAALDVYGRKNGALPKNAVIFVQGAKPAGDLRLRLTFNDGKQRTVDFGPFLQQSRNPLIQAYADPAAFARFTIKDGDLTWNDYDLCFPINDLYEGRPPARA